MATAFLSAELGGDVVVDASRLRNKFGKFLLSLKKSKNPEEANVQEVVDDEDVTDIKDTPVVPMSGPTPNPAQGTPPPAPFMGLYCRGSACQYRVPPVILIPTAPPIPDYFNLLRNREFCRGKACIGGPFGLHGWPASAAADGFALNCGHLFNDVAGGMVGKDGMRSVEDVRQSFLKWCVQRVFFWFGWFVCGFGLWFLGICDLVGFLCSF